MEAPLSGENSWHITDLVIYASGDPPRMDEDVSIADAPRELVDVRHFQIAKALFGGKAENLGEKLPSHWGPVHLFDVCLRFGYWDMAMGMAIHGVPGCQVELHHLETPVLQSEPCRYLREESWTTRLPCCWGFPEENGVWMKDWNLELRDAFPQAWAVAEKPWVRSLLDLIKDGDELPCSVSQEAMARLLDIAILLGEAETAKAIARRCQCFPLRRWEAEDFIPRHGFRDMTHPHKDPHKVLRAALSAGVNLADLDARLGDSWAASSDLAPLATALFLTANSLWMELAGFLPLKPWTCRLPNNTAFFLLEPRGPALPTLNMQMLQQGSQAGLELTGLHLTMWLRESPSPERPYGDVFTFNISLLDYSILSGQPELSVLCCQVTAFSEMTEDGWELYSRVLESKGEDDWMLTFDEFDMPALPAPWKPGTPATAWKPGTADCISSATAAGLVMLKKSFTLHGVECGVAIHQVMRKMCAPRPFPSWLVREVLALSMEVPPLIEQLDLWSEIAGWTTSLTPDGSAGSRSQNLEKDADEGPPDSTSPRAEPVLEEGEVTDDAPKSTQDLMMALQASQDHVPALNVDGVCIWSLTRMSKRPEVSAVLLDACGPLAALHRRVLEAGCEVDPEGNPMKALFVPCTEQQLLELQALTTHGYELCKDQHLLALQEDFQLIDQALRSSIPKKDRPKLKKFCPRSPGCPGPTGPMGSADVPAEEEDDDPAEPMLVLERGLRTDSSLGFPSYQIQ